ncbi:DUF742 domain-containing protein [Saccharothrix sp. 6-C]|uniref:DUF742 domain-containing protein n=1 Tax=Saccharothrix sp. 6-C TaxID=2781735 RepID=UPI001917823B|nr:DUF742 domain-containing protein [Saccharothrix sp. 6-C]QQQ74069.1 DUF742 domain-containing protein [Saccharothrix sp. 6-C]
MTTAKRGSPDPARFGGWTDYREWAEHDFRDRRAAEEPGPPTDAAIVVEALTDLVPIKVLVREENSGSRRSCLVPSSGVGGPEIELGPAPELGDAALIRPYVRPAERPDVQDDDFGFETVVELARPLVSLPAGEMTDDQRAVCRVCVVPQSVAEVAVAISAPLGLTRTIIGECIGNDYLRVHETAPLVNGLPSMDLLRRVYSGLSQLSDTR